VLPSACFAEKEGTFTNTERRVQRVRKAVAPPGDARADLSIICDLSTRLGYPMRYEGAEAVFAEMASVTPSYAGLSYARIEKEGIPWPCPVPDHPGTPVLHMGSFSHGKGIFFAIDYIPPAETVDDDYPLYLTTGRVLYHYHTGTMTMKSEGLMDRAPECFVEIHPSDAKNLGVAEGTRVTVTSRRGSIEAVARVSPRVRPGMIFIPFHYAQAAANRLTNARLDPISGIPEFKVCAVKLAKAA
jgi:predicted molibdopterin-dependent oxidoreductase YjgC